METIKTKQISASSVISWKWGSHAEMQKDNIYFSLYIVGIFVTVSNVYFFFI